MATLEQFLRTGELGPLHPGMSQADVASSLGTPQDESLSARAPILRYGGLQLAFHRDRGAADARLQHLGLYYRPPEESIPELARPSDFRGTSSTTLAEVREYLDRVGMKEYAVEEQDATTYLIFSSGARITFDDQVLWSVNFSARTFSRAKKQISVSLPADTWDQVLTLARQSKRSVTELCAEWITQRASAAELRERTRHEVKGGAHS